MEFAVPDQLETETRSRAERAPLWLDPPSDQSSHESERRGDMPRQRRPYIEDRLLAGLEGWRQIVGGETTSAPAAQ
jgi:hypothetical protein